MATFDPHTYATPRKRAKVYELLDIPWPGMGERIPLLEAAGYAWHEISTPFVLWEDAAPIAHAGVLEIDLVVGGEPMRVGGIHAVVTHPDHRGRGHMRVVMERAMAHCDERYATTILFGGPPLYERYGFRLAPRYKYVDDVEPVEPTVGVEPFQTITDIADLRNMLERRDHLSDVLGVRRSGHMFICDILLASQGMGLVFRAGDIFAAYQLKDGELLLLDVVAEQLPTLAEILARVPEPVHTVRFGWTPDRMNVPGVRCIPRDDDDDTVMVKGPWPIEGKPFEFPMMTVC